jgi:hypothetical protein
VAFAAAEAAEARFPAPCLFEGALFPFAFLAAPFVAIAPRRYHRAQARQPQHQRSSARREGRAGSPAWFSARAPGLRRMPCATSTTPSRSFTLRELREHTGLGLTQAKPHLRRLIETEYVASQRTGRTFAYDVIRSGADRWGRGAVGPWSATTPDRIGLRETDGKGRSEGFGRGDSGSTNGAPDAPRRRT